ncbi:MAG: putative addiction module antidote protein [Eggerthellaceae bacterium]|nr:putative addiction module antidote protein [Eggerthellaceae bacterium]
MRTTRFDAADYLETPEDVADFINIALEDGDPVIIKHAIGTAARSKGMAAIAEETDLNRTSLYRAFEEGGNPQFATVLKVLASLGLSLQVVPTARKASA